MILFIIIGVSTLLFKVLGVKNVVWSRGKAWGVYGREFLLRFSNHDPNAYIFMYAFHRQFNHDHVNSFSSKENKKRRKKTIKKPVNLNNS